MAKKSDLRLVVSKSCIELGQAIEKHLKQDYGYKGELIIPLNEVKFSSGESKTVLEESIRGKDVFYMTDVTNHGITYTMYKELNRMSPQDYFYDVLSTITAMHGHASRITEVLPFFPEWSYKVYNYI